MNINPLGVDTIIRLGRLQPNRTRDHLPDPKVDGEFVFAWHDGSKHFVEEPASVVSKNPRIYSHWVRKSDSKTTG